MHTKEEIRRESWKRMSTIEEVYGSMYRLPSHVMAAYRLYSVLYEANLERYFANYGWLPIDPSEVREAKAEFKWGTDATSFELEIIDLVNATCLRNEEQSRQQSTSTLAN